jgi:accessory colonization factor AcfC
MVLLLFLKEAQLLNTLSSPVAVEEVEDLTKPVVEVQVD